MYILRHISLVVVSILWASVGFAQSALYERAYDQLDSMLSNHIPLSFKDAVFATENAYMEGEASRVEFETEIMRLRHIVLGIETGEMMYDYKDKTEVQKHAALYRVITDTTTVVDGNDTLYHLPLTYDFNDSFGDGDWHNMFVTKLLATKKGNCHSLPYLYKILADEIGVETHLALAPNHVYIKQRCEATGWYNTELTSASFPVDAWIMASGYVFLEAIQNGIYMKALNDTEALAMCIVDLAMGYDRKFPGNDGTFVLKCCELALKHFPNYITAILLKAETMKRQIEQMMQRHNVEHPQDLFIMTSEAEPFWKQMEQTYFHAHKSGYRQMPKQMYLDWLSSLHTEREKYDNRKVTRFNK